MTITCGIQPTNVVTMVMKVLHNSCNMCTLDLTDMYALALGMQPSFPCIHINQVTRAHVTTTAYTRLAIVAKGVDTI